MIAVRISNFWLISRGTSPSLDVSTVMARRKDPAWTFPKLFIKSHIELFIVEFENKFKWNWPSVFSQSSLISCGRMIVNFLRHKSLASRTNVWDSLISVSQFRSKILEKKRMDSILRGRDWLKTFISYLGGGTTHEDICTIGILHQPG